MIQNNELHQSHRSTPIDAIDHHSVTTISWAAGAATVAGLAALAHARRRGKRKTSNQSAAPTPKFTNENITSSFVTAIPSISRELNLEVASATQTETLSRSSAKKGLWGLINMGTTFVQVRVPVTYRFHIRLRDPWKLEVVDNKVVVLAPALSCSLPPAIQTDKIERLTVRGWCRGSPRQLLAKLESEITPTLSEYAPRQIESVRHECRESVAEFIRLWLEREGRWGKDGFTAIEVRFADEPRLPAKSSLGFLK